MVEDAIGQEGDVNAVEHVGEPLYHGGEAGDDGGEVLEYPSGVQASGCCARSLRNAVLVRRCVEAAFAPLKNDTTGNVKRDWTRQVGIIKTTLLLAVAVTSSNLRQLLTWSRDTGDVTDPLTRMEVGPAAFEEIDPATGGVGDTGPPTAA